MAESKIKAGYYTNPITKKVERLPEQMQMRHSSLATTQNYLNDNQLKWVKQVDNVKVIA